MRALPKALRFVVLADCVLFLSGCVFWTPAVDAHLYDARTLAPVAGATVKAFPTDWTIRSATIVSKDDGGVHVPELDFWAPALGDPGLSLHLSLHIEAPGFKPRDVIYPEERDLSRILLEPLDKASAP